MNLLKLEIQYQQKYEQYIKLERRIQEGMSYLPYMYERRHNAILCRGLNKAITQQDILAHQLQILNSWIEDVKECRNGSVSVARTEIACAQSISG